MLTIDNIDRDQKRKTGNQQVLNYDIFAYAMNNFLIFQKHKHLGERGATHRAAMTSISFINTVQLITYTER